MIEYVALATAVVGVIALVLKYILSGQAQKDADEALRRKKQEEEKAAVDEKIKNDLGAKPTQTEGAGSAWDAADRQ
jgi:hypothetical protein